MIFKFKGGNYCSHFSVIFQATNKFLNVLVRLVLGKVRADGFTKPGWEIDIRYEFDLKVLLMCLGWKCLQPFLTEFPRHK